ncbi:MAG: phosphatase PAP2 family protein [Pirellulales bacterium]|nr:phosphatase PAP2 family protein [Pirellulales bacterium]
MNFPYKEPSFFSDKHAFKTRLFLVGLLVAVGILAFSIDISIAQWVQATRLPKELMRYLNLAEVFGHGIGVAMIMIGVFCLDRSMRFPSIYWPAIRWPTYQPTIEKRYGARMLGGLLLGPIGVLVLKLLIDRSRPRATDFSLVTSVLDTFGSHSVIAGPLRSNDLHSFPSGHSATAAALATVLIWKYPQGRLFFIVVATSACLQRIASMAHYPSDVCFGAACGVLGAALVLGPNTTRRSA